jgi:hypothetical protein
MKNKKEKGWNPEVNRRWVLRKAAAAGGALLVAPMIATPLKAQFPTVKSSGTVQPIDTASLGRIRTAYQQIKTTGNYKTVGSGWAPAVKSLTPQERLATVWILEVSQRNTACKDIGGKIGLVMRGTLEATSNTLTEIRNQVIQQATGGGCGGDCQGTWGFGCGMRCAGVKDVMLAVDQAGMVLLQTDMANAFRDYGQITAAVNGAASAYREIFG